MSTNNGTTKDTNNVTTNNDTARQVKRYKLRKLYDHMQPTDFYFIVERRLDHKGLVIWEDTGHPHATKAIQQKEVDRLNGVR